MKDHRLSESLLRFRYFSIIPASSHHDWMSRSICGKSTLLETGLNRVCDLSWSVVMPTCSFTATTRLTLLYLEDRVRSSRN